MSWLTNIWDGVKSVGSKVVSVVKKVATPALSFAAGLVPGVGSLLSKGVDIVGNKLLGDEADPSSDAGAASATPVSDLLAQLTGQAVGLGSSPAAQAMASATVQAAETPALASSLTSSTSSGFLGIGDGKPGVLGIGTGKNKARKAAEATAAAAGATPAQVKLAGDQAAAKVTDSGSGTESSTNPLLIGAGILLALLAL